MPRAFIPAFVPEHAGITGRTSATQSERMLLDSSSLQQSLYDQRDVEVQPESEPANMIMEAIMESDEVS
jgi:hypothetical protein